MIEREQTFFVQDATSFHEASLSLIGGTNNAARIDIKEIKIRLPQAEYASFLELFSVNVLNPKNMRNQSGTYDQIISARHLEEVPGGANSIVWAEYNNPVNLCQSDTQKQKQKDAPLKLRFRKLDGSNFQMLGLFIRLKIWYNEGILYEPPVEAFQAKR